jgi:uncharacterized membrane protein
MLQYLSQPFVSQYLIAAIFIIAGTFHFIKPGAYIFIMPDYLPWHKALVYISGAAEILGGIGALMSGTRLWAAWGLIALLIAVFPANIDMTLQAWRHQGWQSWYFLGTVLRLPLQFVLIYWIYWACVQH